MEGTDPLLRDPLEAPGIGPVAPMFMIGRSSIQSKGTYFAFLSSYNEPR